MSIPSDAELLRRAYEEVQRLRAELADAQAVSSRRSNHLKAYASRAWKAEAALARVWAVLADPPVPSRMLIPVIRDAIEGRPVNICICCGARLGEFQNINNEWACGPCVEWETK